MIELAVAGKRYGVQHVDVDDGGQRYGLSACGIGPSTPREGGVLLTPKEGEVRRHIGFDFR